MSVAKGERGDGNRSPALARLYHGPDRAPARLRHPGTLRRGQRRSTLYRAQRSSSQGRCLSHERGSQLGPSPALLCRADHDRPDDGGGRATKGSSSAEELCARHKGGIGKHDAIASHVAAHHEPAGVDDPIPFTWPRLEDLESAPGEGGEARHERSERRRRSASRGQTRDVIPFTDAVAMLREELQPSTTRRASHWRVRDRPGRGRRRSASVYWLRRRGSAGQPASGATSCSEVSSPRP